MLPGRLKGPGTAGRPRSTGRGGDRGSGLRLPGTGVSVVRIAAFLTASGGGGGGGIDPETKRNKSRSFLAGEVEGEM